MFQKNKKIATVTFLTITLVFIGYHCYCHYMVGKLYKYIDAGDTEGAISCIEEMPNVNMLPVCRPLYNILGFCTQYASSTGYPVYYAIWEKTDASVIEALLGKGADPDKKSFSFSETPLHCLCGHLQKDMYEKITLLIEYGADVNEGYINIPASWEEMSEASKEEMFRSEVCLWESGVDEWEGVDTKYKRTVLHSAVEILDSEYLEKMYKNKKRPMNKLLNAQDANGETPLFYAVRAGKFDSCSFLIDEGADIDIQNNEGKTAYDVAVELGHEECMEILESEIR